MAAELVGGACLSAFLQVAFAKLASPEVVDYLRGKKLGDVLINDLKIAMLAVNAVLFDAEAKQINNPCVKQWLDELEDTSYVADDLLDEISTHALQSKLEAESRKSMMSKLSYTFSKSRRSYIQDMKNHVKEILRRLKSLEGRIYVLGLNKGVSEKTWSIPPTTSLVEESEVYGRDGDKETTIKLLLEDGKEGSDTLSVIPIVGLGGIGKTTLAQSVYNDHRIQEHFELRSWVCVSEEFDIYKVTNTIFCSVPKSHSHSYDYRDLNWLQSELKEELVGKKFLVVLDDVWNQNYENWKSLKKPFEHGAQGSKILVTTRNEKVAHITQTVPCRYLGELSEDDCWKLFVKHAFGNKNCNEHPKFEAIGRNIVKKCKGLPLAAKTLGGLLRSREDVVEWERVLESEIWELPYDESNILPALMLSYHHLPSHIKRCYAFCSVFPKDYEFRRHQLVLYWMAENLVQQTSRIRRMEDVGYDYFNELLSRSFFQRYTGWSGEPIFVMHDLVHDLARFVSRGYSFTLETGNSKGEMMKARHLAVSGESLDSISKAVHLRSLILLDQYSSFEAVDDVILNSSFEAVNDVILKCRCLRILSLYGCGKLKRLSESVGELKHLRFLDLSRTSIERLPNSVTKLYNIQTLKLSFCYELTELPEDMHHLINLRHLDIRECGKLEKMPSRIGELESLQTLSIFIVGKDDGAKIVELRELSDLHGEIALKNLGNVKSATDASEARLMDKERITSIDLHWCGRYRDTEAGINEREVAEKLLPHANLESVSIIGYGGASFPSWLGDVSFCHIVSIKVKDCRNCSRLPPLGLLPSLKSLQICGLSEVISVGAEFLCGIGGYSPVRITPFASLEFLHFVNMSQWEEWCLKIGVENREAFPRLQKLLIEGCDKLRRVDWTDCLPCLTILIVNAESEAGILESMSLPKTPILRELKIGRSSLYVLELPKTPILRINARREELPQKVELFEITPLKIMCERVCISVITSLSERIRSSIAEIQIFSCNSLVFFHLDLFPNLCSLEIYGCQRLECVGVSSSTNGLASLSEITIRDCKKLKKVLPEQMHDLLPSLGTLGIFYCQELESFPEGVLPSNLKRLSILDCPKLTANRMSWNLQRLPALERFGIGDVVGAESFPEEGFLPSSVSNLEISGFPNLKRLDIKGLQQLTSLQDLTITRCHKLEKLPPQGLPTSLTRIRIAECPLLQQRCQRDTGEDWHIISHIRDIRIW